MKPDNNKMILKITARVINKPQLAVSSVPAQSPVTNWGCRIKVEG